MADKQTSVKKGAKKYVALMGINFDGLEGKPRIEAGSPLPDGLTEKEIQDLIAIKAIKVDEKK